MNRRPPPRPLLAAFLLFALTATAARAQFTWTGLGMDGDIATGTNWKGGTAPIFDGSEDLRFGKAINNDVTLSGDISVNSITLTGSDSYHFTYYVDPTITIGNGVGNGIYGSLTGTGNRLVFDETIDFTSVGGLHMDAGNSFIVMTGKITGSNDVYLSNARGGTSGAFIFNSTCTGSSYTGDTYITGISGNPVVVAFWNDQPFGDGTGTLYIQNSAQLIAHGSRDVYNTIEFSANGTTDPIYFKSWDDTLYMDGDVTLANNTTLVAQLSQSGVDSADNSGVFPVPGPRSRNAIEFDGAIDESGGSHSMTVSGAGVIVFDGNNTYTGGTTVNGSLVFGTTISAPSGVNKVKVTASGYAGFADDTPGNFATFLNTKIDKVNSSGAVGVDTYPGDSTYTFTDNINLSGFTNPGIRIGTATSAIITGTITPQNNGAYQFGNGGGTLYVQSNLTDLSGPSAVNMNNNSVVPLTVYLQGGSNTYTGGTNVTNGFVIFDSDGAFPSSGALTASGAGNSYIGITDEAYISTATFLSRFNVAGTNGIIGFDTHSGSSMVVISDPIDLSAFNNGVYLGTATAVEFSGPLTPAADNVLRLTAAQGGFLQIDGPLNGTMSLSLGTTSPNDIYSNGTVAIYGNNNYSGGTTINSTVGGLTLQVGSDTALGTGPLNIPQGVIAGIKGATYGITVPNNIVFAAGGSPGSLYFLDNVGLDLTGNISGPGSLYLMDPSTSPYVNLYGNNTFTGDINLYSATLSLYNDNAAGLGSIRFLDNSTVNIDTTAPVIYGLGGEDGSINLNNGQALTIDISNNSNDHHFGGHIGNESSPNASLTVTSTTGGDALYLSGNNNYTGGTFITNKGAVALGNSQALGSGPVTLNTSIGGAIALNVGVGFSNDLIYTGGMLQGFGTFSPASVNGTPGGAIVFDSGKGVVGGVFGLGTRSVPGQLTITNSVDLANGGIMVWTLQNADQTGGFSQLSVSGGNLNISATTGQFHVFLASLDSNGTAGWANLTGGQAYSLAIATTTGTLTGFNASDFTLDTSLFQNSFIVSPFLTADANNLYLNFTAVPEPSTYALMGLGLGAVLFPALRRRKRA